MDKSFYSVEFRKSVVGEILEARAGNPNFNMAAFVREKHPELVVKLVYVWIELVGKELGMSINIVYNKTGNAANELSLEQKR